ncbi:MAG: SRPBCC domain-containing protein [Gammaproteobacteria bacterium]
MMKTVLIRCIAARPAIVFDALVTAEGIGSWWGPDDLPAESAEADTRVGGSFRVMFRMMDDSEHECAGEFLEIVRPERAIMSWRWVSGGAPEERGNTSRLEFHLRPIDTGTELTLVHAELINQASASSHEWGWDGALRKLIRRFSEAGRDTPWA